MLIVSPPSLLIVSIAWGERGVVGIGSLPELSKEALCYHRASFRLVGARGFEPPTSTSRTWRSTRLSHAPTCLPRPERRMVPKVGFEPTRGRPQRFLRPPRLPFRHSGVMCEIIAEPRRSVNRTFSQLGLPPTLTPCPSPSRGEGRFRNRTRPTPPLPLRERGLGGEG